MKKCSKCKIEKELSCFGRNAKNNKDGLSAYCKTCMRSYTKNNYINNKERLDNNQKNRRKDNREWVLKFKTKCSMCEEDHISCLEFHHLDSNTKEYSISKMLSTFKNKEKILKEMEKCIVLCSNCHRKFHWNEKYK